MMAQNPCSLSGIQESQRPAPQVVAGYARFTIFTDVSANPRDEGHWLDASCQSFHMDPVPLGLVPLSQPSRPLALATRLSFLHESAALFPSDPTFFSPNLMLVAMLLSFLNTF